MLMTVGPLTISAAHFIHTCDYNSPCQRMHGHNYIVNITISGEPDNCSCMLIDANIVKKAIEQYDHRTLVAKKCVKFDDNFMLGANVDRFLTIENPTTKKVFILPESNCHIIDIPATSAEWLAKAIARDILAINNNIYYVDVNLSETPKLNVTVREHAVRYAAKIMSASQISDSCKGYIYSNRITDGIKIDGTKPSKSAEINMCIHTQVCDIIDKQKKSGVGGYNGKQ